MTDILSSGKRVSLGDPVPWFSAALVSGGQFDLHVSAGRWVVLSFLGSPADPRANEELNALLREAELFREDHMVAAVVLTAPPADVAVLASVSSNALSFLADYDGAISRAFGASEMPRTIVLDPMLRAIADIAWDNPQEHAQTVRNVLRGLPAADRIPSGNRTC
jgi:peroxiredoxin